MLNYIMLIMMKFIFQQEFFMICEFLPNKFIYEQTNTIVFKKDLFISQRSKAELKIIYSIIS